ncbi:molecular chaperone [Acinetobacter sp.]|jgi:chaperone protein EcpD|uniref:Putative fimbrial chaperone YadV n=1 Tax=Acinetobacter bereziniae TaxID=106648 RepID=A0A833PHR2_ACIBZ|nr:molecular chaperone [Acinetobacter sp.]KAF1027707.1 MAG: putative fimbrial chaperone YadV [Acinetobacter bereziniae]MDR0235911.1 molecular chaperone [Acinetobacter sp.]
MKIKFFISTLLTLGTYITSAQAGIVITGTRVIYPSDKEFVSVQLTNVGDQIALVQSWIDDKDIIADPTTTKAPFVVTPPITTIETSKGQSLRVIFNQKQKLATDRETLFWLNVLDVPAKPEAGKNYLQFAIRNRLKLFYRPTGIKMEQQQSFQKVEVQRVHNQLEINNPTPYYLNFAKSNLIQKNGTLGEIKNLSFIEPFSKQQFDVENLSDAKSVQLSLIDDYGSLSTIEKKF